MLIWIDLGFFYTSVNLSACETVSRNQNSARVCHFRSKRRQEVSRGLSREKKKTDSICFLLNVKPDVERPIELFKL